MKNIVIISRGDNWKKDKPISSDAARVSYENWHDWGVKNSVLIYHASIKWYDFSKNIFLKTWSYRKGKWVKNNKSVKPDLIFDKIKGSRDYEMFDYKMGVNKKTKIINSPLFRALVDNKLNQYLLFSDIMPKTILINNRNDLVSNINKLDQSKVVLKPFYGSGGFGITICDKKSALNKDIEYPILLQEFINSRGIPNFSNKNEIADLRLIYINKELIYALSRIAKKGSLFTNFHQGASAILVPKNKIPKKTIVIANKIIKKLSVFKGIHYSLDFIFDKNGQPIFMEMNSTPGLDLLGIVGTNDIKNNFYKKIKGLIL